MRVGIFFGGPSRERNQSLRNGRAAYASLDRRIFEPVPIFLDAKDRLFQMQPAVFEAQNLPELIRANTAAATYQLAQESLPDQPAVEWLRYLEAPLNWETLNDTIDFAWVAARGQFAEDGQLQQRLENAGLCYSGFNPATCRYTADNSRLRDLLELQDFSAVPAITLSRAEWEQTTAAELYERLQDELPFPWRIRPADLPTTSGQTTLPKAGDLERFELAVNRAFFQEVIPVAEWVDRNEFERRETIQLLSDLEDGLGFPIEVVTEQARRVFQQPEALLQYLDELSAAKEAQMFKLNSQLGDWHEKILIEQVPGGIPFHCTVIASPFAGLLALPPQVPREYETAAFLDTISDAATTLFQRLDLQAFAQISGYSLEDGALQIDQITSQPDLDTGSALMTVFGQAGLSPAQALTTLVHASVKAASPSSLPLLQRLEERLERAGEASETPIAVLCGGTGYNGKRSLRDGREVFQWLDGQPGFRPIPLWVTEMEGKATYHRLPLHLFLGATMPVLHHLVASPALPPAPPPELKTLAARYGSRSYPNAPEACPISNWPALAQYVWISLHAQPEAAGPLQAQLQRLGLPHNSSGEKTAAICGDKYQLWKTLSRNNFSVPHQLRLTRDDYEQETAASADRLEHQLSLPIIAKPLDEASSTGVQLLSSRAMLEAYLRLLFRPAQAEGQEARRALKLKPGAAFPQKTAMVGERQVVRKGATRFLEISAHVLIQSSPKGEWQYKWLPLSQMQPQEEVVRAWEKYEQASDYSTTPPLLSEDTGEQQQLTNKIIAELERAARLLNLEGIANLDAFVHLYEDQSLDVTIFDVNTGPSPAPGALLWQQAKAGGQPIGPLISGLIEQRLRHALAEEPDSPPVPPQASAKPSYKDNTMKEDAKQPSRTSAAPGPGSRGFKPQPLWDYIKESARYLLGEIWLFLKSPVFLLNFAGILLMVFSSILLTRWALKIYTHHGESIQVPDYIGMDMRDAERKARKQNFSLVAIDSFFDSSKRPNTIYHQTPEPNQRAKEGRTIYVSKYRAQADSVLLPTLVRAGYNYSQYITKLRRLDVKGSIRKRVFDNKQEENTILYLFYNGRKITDDLLRRGVKVPRGSTLEFVITERITNEVPLPDLICKRYEEATFLLTSSNLSLGQTIGAEGVESNAFVYRQEPEFLPGKMIPKGTAVDLYLSTTRPDGCPATADEWDVLDNDDEDF